MQDVGYDELGQIRLSNGERRACRVLEVDGTRAVVQLFESAAGICMADAGVRFLGRPMQLGVSPDMLGRVFSGMGEVIDGGAPLLCEQYLDISGTAHESGGDAVIPMSLFRRAISAIDGLNTLVRGQKLPIFSGSGLPHAQLAAQIARQAQVPGDAGDFAVVFAAIGITFEEAEFLRARFSPHRRAGADGAVHQPGRRARGGADRRAAHGAHGGGISGL